MEIHVLAVGALQTNCYLIDTGAGNAIIVDPGANPGGILEFLSREHLRPVYLIYTHGHYDHIGATTPLRQAGAKAILPREDRDLFLNPALIGAGLFTHFRGYTPEEPDLLCGEGDKVELDGLRLTFLHTPGHSKGSSVLMGDGVLFTGDTLFAGTAAERLPEAPGRPGGRLPDSSRARAAVHALRRENYQSLSGDQL